MKKLFRYFTFIFFILSLVIILINANGLDDKNILLIGFNPILNILVYKEPFRSIIWNDGPTFNMYLAHLFTFVIYGGIIDILVTAIKSFIKK